MSVAATRSRWWVAQTVVFPASARSLMSQAMRRFLESRFTTAFRVICVGERGS